MNVYARFLIDDGFAFRLNTVLQFGEGWNVIGAAVLVNPGSAKPVVDVSDCGTLAALSDITGKNDCWKQFSADPTMRFLKKIFDGSYIGEQKKLNGVVLLYNLFNLRNANLQQALEVAGSCKSPLLFCSNEDIASLKAVEKVYLGWGKEGVRPVLRPMAEKVFNAVKDSNAYLYRDFDKNKFRHPMYINRAISRDKEIRKVLTRFGRL